MAASGPKAIEVAGEVADGVLLLVGFNRGIIERALDHLERGAKRGGRRLDDLEIIWAVRIGTAATTAEARRVARPTAVHWGVLRWGGYWLEPAGLTLPKLEVPDAVHRIYPDLSHAHDWEAAIAATAFVPDEVAAQLCDAVGLIGTAADCADPHPRDGEARRAQSLPHAAADLHPARGGDRRLPRRRVPAAARGGVGREAGGLGRGGGRGGWTTFRSACCGGQR